MSTPEQRIAEERVRAAERVAIPATAVPTAPVAGPLVSWSTVWAGTLFALAGLVVLMALGVAVGASVLDLNPLSAHAAQGWTVGTGAWTFGSMLIALFLGGVVSTRLRTFVPRPAFLVSGTLVWMLVLIAMTGMGFARRAADRMLTASPPASEATIGPNLSHATPALAAAIDAHDVDGIIARLNDPATADRVASEFALPRDQVVIVLREASAATQANRADPARAAEATRGRLDRLATGRSGLPVGTMPTLGRGVLVDWLTFAGLVVTLGAAIGGAAAGSFATPRYR